jgi:hypothetical protein
MCMLIIIAHWLLILKIEAAKTRIIILHGSISYLIAIATS